MFYVYQHLAPKIKRIATSHWTYELLRRVKSDNLNTLPIKLEKIIGEEGYAEKKQAQSYWYKKFSGQPLQNSIEVDEVDSVLIGTSHILYHPLWTLLSDNKVTKSKLVWLTHQLPFPIQNKILNINDEFIFSLDNRLDHSNSLDAVAALLIAHLWQKKTCDKYEEELINGKLLKLILRLFSFSFEKARYGFELCQYICNHFHKPNDYKNINTITLKNFPYNLSQINSLKKFSSCCRLYRDISQKIHFCDKLEISEDSQLTYMSFIEHSKLNALNLELQQSKGICPEECGSELGKLRIYFHYRKKDGVILLPKITNFFDYALINKMKDQVFKSV